MNNHKTEVVTSQVLPWVGVRPWLIQLGFIGAAVALPAMAHLMGLPVRWLLPMHWPVILAGLLYGWRGGLIVGLLSPASNWLLTGYPLPLKLLPMMLELAVYGGLTGWLVERGWRSWKAMTLSLVAGRVVFLGTILTLGATDGMGFWTFTGAAVLPGLAAGAVMVVILPRTVSMSKNR